MTNSSKTRYCNRRTTTNRALMTTSRTLLILLSAPQQTKGSDRSLASRGGRYSRSVQMRTYDPLNAGATCYAPLSDADSDSDGRLSREEYAQLVLSLSNADGEGSSANADGAGQENFGDLAFELQTGFVYLNCLCGSGESGDCCDGYIDISGANSSDATEEQLAHLDALCFRTQYVLDSISSASGDGGAISTESPMTAAPTETLSTPAPSARPSPSPAEAPTLSPVESPTYSPLAGPIISTSSPVATPTTDSPTLSPSQKPVPLPSETPVDASSPSSDPAALFTEAPAVSAAPTSPQYVPQASTGEPSYPLLSHQPSYAPSSHDNAGYVESSEEEDSTEKTGTPPSVVAVAILVPLVAMALFLFGLYVLRKMPKSERDAEVDEHDAEADEFSAYRQNMSERVDEEMGTSAAVEPRLWTSEQLRGGSTKKVNKRGEDVGVGVANRGEDVGLGATNVTGEADSSEDSDGDEDDDDSESVVSSASTEVGDNRTNQSFRSADEFSGEVAVASAIAAKVEDDKDREGVPSEIMQGKVNAKGKVEAVASVEGEASPKDDSEEEGGLEPVSSSDLTEVGDNRSVGGMAAATSAVALAEGKSRPEERSVSFESGAGESSISSSVSVKMVDDDEVSSLSVPFESKLFESRAKSQLGLIAAAKLLVQVEDTETKKRQSMPKDDSSASSDYSSASESSPSNALLDRAIEKGDWKAIGKVAASIATIDVTDDKGPSGDSDDNDTYRDSFAVRTERLDNLISSGDWRGLAHTARTYSSFNSESESDSDDEKMTLDKPASAQLEDRQKLDTESSSSVAISAENTIAVNASGTEAEGGILESAAAAVAVGAAAAVAVGFATKYSSPREVEEQEVDDSKRTISDVSPDEKVATVAAIAGEPRSTDTTAQSFPVGRGNEEMSGLSSPDSAKTNEERVPKPGVADDEYSLEEIKARINFLINSVFTDEREHVDELLMQFNGRENELLSTLETMTEKRLSQKDAAKALGLQETAEAAPDNDDASGSSSDSSSSSDTSSSESDSDTEDSSAFYNAYHERHFSKSLLELAIERSDWKAVGQAAAIMGRNAPSTAIADDDTSSSDSSTYYTSDTSTTSILQKREREKDKRRKHLEKLIVRGDWTGLVVAAGQYQALDEEFNTLPKPTGTMT